MTVKYSKTFTMECEHCVYSEIADWEQDEKKKQEKQRLYIGVKSIKSTVVIYQNAYLRIMELSKMTKEEKTKAIAALKLSAPVKAMTQEEFEDYIRTINKIMDWLEQPETVTEQKRCKA